MALLFVDGFDAGDSLIKWVNTGTGNTTTTTTRFNTGRALFININAVYRDFPAAANVIVGVAMNSNSSPSFQLFGDSGATQHLSVQVTNTAILLFRGGTQIGSYGGSFPNNVYYYIECSATISSTVGTAIVRLNGVTVINFSGNTKNGGTNTTIDRLQLNSSGSGGWFDDLYLCDGTGSAPYNTFLGDVRVHSLVPSGAGSSTQFTPSTGANYTTVDELPYSATDYVSSGTTGNRDTYAMSDLPASAGTVYAVQHNVIAKKTDAGATSIKSAIKSGAGVYYGSPVVLGGADASIRDLHIADPNTSASWTVSGVNALEGGFEVA